VTEIAGLDNDGPTKMQGTLDIVKPDRTMTDDLRTGIIWLVIRMLWD